MMQKDEILQIQEHLKGLPVEIYEKHNDTIIKIPSDNLLKLIQFLYTEKSLNFKFLSNITCIDKMTDIKRFQLVYNLYNFDDKRSVTVITYADEKSFVQSLTPIFKGANWYEREIYDMFGLSFNAHPDLRRILLPFNWKGYPLRKDYPIGGEEVTFSFSKDFGKGKPVTEDELALWEEEEMLEATDELLSKSASGFRKKDNPSTMIVNMGPQHPSTHGVLRLVVELDGEKIKSVVPYIGYLHTGIEKNIENLTYQQALTLTDRMDYLAPLSNNLGYVLAVEKLLDLEIPARAQYIRVMLVELQRIASHLVWLATHALDIGVMSIFFYCFNAREEILSMFEHISGVRLMTSYINIGGLRNDLPDGFLDTVRNFIKTFPDKIKEYETLLTKNKIWMDRTIGIGYLSKEDTINYGITGPMLRALGIKHDLRKIKPYSGYENFKFDIPTAKNGDVYDRYLVRIEEMKQSLEIIRQTVENLPDGEVKASNRKLVPPPKDELLTSMEAVIHHFLLYGIGFSIPSDEIYLPIESPRGELGYYIVSDGTPKPYRVKVRAPSFANLQAIPDMAVGSLLADLVAIIGSIDPVMGEVDR